MFALVLAVLAAAALGAAVVASADDGHGKGDDNDGRRHQNAARIYSAALAPSVPSDPAVHGVPAGGAPWVLDRGQVKLGADGHIKVELRGLVIPVAHGTFPAGTARPVTTVRASLFCAPDTSGAAATTGSVPISEDGDARIDDRIALPSTCLAPTVLVQPNALDAYIALPGWRS
ncbi:MAG TPA: hypothetical protein VFU56_05150 [Gaiellaceae bacterium]|nr:hypothetical protein [Gaiellaceae bacterium]